MNTTTRSSFVSILEKVILAHSPIPHAKSPKILHKKELITWFTKTGFGISSTHVTTPSPPPHPICNSHSAIHHLCVLCFMSFMLHIYMQHLKSMHSWQCDLEVMIPSLNERAPKFVNWHTIKLWLSFACL